MKVRKFLKIHERKIFWMKDLPLTLVKVKFSWRGTQSHTRKREWATLLLRQCIWTCRSLCLFFFSKTGGLSWAHIIEGFCTSNPALPASFLCQSPGTNWQSSSGKKGACIFTYLMEKGSLLLFEVPVSWTLPLCKQGSLLESVLQGLPCVYCPLTSLANEVTAHLNQFLNEDDNTSELLKTTWWFNEHRTPMPIPYNKLTYFPSFFFFFLSSKQVLTT